MTIKIGTRCRVINATVPSNNGAIVIVVGDAGLRPTIFGITQCYFVDRPLRTKKGELRNWGPEVQLEPIDNLVSPQKKVTALCI